MKHGREDSEEESDVDQDFLDRVLNKLYDFGDGPKGKRSKIKPNKRKRVNDEEEVESFNEHDGANLSNVSGEERIPMSTSSDSTSKISPKKMSDIEIVTFQDPLKKNKIKKAVEPRAKPPEVRDQQKEDPDDNLSIEQARLDVHRFGIAGFQKQQQRVFEQDRAIMLGARPPKKEYVNYKVYQQMIKEKKMKEKEEMKLDTQAAKRRKSGKPGKQKTEKRKSGASGGEAAGQVGHFKNGMLVLSNKDIHKLKVKVRK